MIYDKETLLSNLHLQPAGKDTWRLLVDFEYKGILVPAGFITNGANIPRIFWFFLST